MLMPSQKSGERRAVRWGRRCRRSWRSCRPRPRCASCRAFLLPRSCGGTSAACAAPETVCPARRCSGWSSAWLGACPCCGGGDTQKTCRENRLMLRKTCTYTRLLPLSCAHATADQRARKSLHASVSVMLFCPPGTSSPPGRSCAQPTPPPRPAPPRPAPPPPLGLPSLTPTEHTETSRCLLSCSSTGIMQAANRRSKWGRSRARPCRSRISTEKAATPACLSPSGPLSRGTLSEIRKAAGFCHFASASAA